MIHRPNRLVEIIEEMKKQGMEPKRMQLVHPYIDKRANMVMIEAVRGGKSLLLVEEPLVIYKEQGVYTQAVLDIYGK